MRTDLSEYKNIGNLPLSLNGFGDHNTTDDRHSLEKDSWWRSMSAALAMLKHAHSMIARAEEKIAVQDQRISQLEALATSDTLTGILNRRGFYEAFLRELDRSNRDQNNGGTLVLIDLDNFKTINDTYGHMAGDNALRLVARTLAVETRAMDVVARLGGDEFVLLLSGACPASGARRAQKIGWKINQLVLDLHEHKIPVQASIGLRHYCAGDKADRIFNAADIALYESKSYRKEKGTT